MAGLRLDEKMTVAWYVAAGVHFSGLVRYSSSSQLLMDGMILKGLGSLPL